jgi:hypothetical protein
MRREWDMVSEIYGEREDVPIEANLEFGVGKDDLRQLLKQDTDLFHYIGHVDDRGFDCIDGFVDATELDEIGMQAFLLNACHSFAQGEALIEAGASAGIVSLSEVGNQSAMEFGKTLAKLFYHGFSVGTGLNLAYEYSDFGSRYIAIGDAGLMLAQNGNTTGVFYEIDNKNDKSLTIDIYSYPNRDYPIGCFVGSLLEDDIRYLISSHLTSIDISEQEFGEVTNRNIFPIVSNGNLVWSNEWPK